MTTLHYFSKTLFRYFAAIVGLTAFGLFLFVGGVFYLFRDQLSQEHAPSQLQAELVSEDRITLTDPLIQKLEKEGIWLMVLDETGQVEQEHDLPNQLNRTYSPTDIASFTRWYLDDYPVFTYIVGNKLLVLGYPKDSYTRINETIQISVFQQLFFLLVGIALLLLLVLFLFYWRSRLSLLREMAPITTALSTLSKEKAVSLDEKGNLSEIKAAINQTSQLLQHTKDMQNHWIRGVTHDLRTPLTLALAYTDQLAEQHGRSTQTQLMEQNLYRMEGIIDNLNLVYRLQGQDLHNSMLPLSILPFLRHIAADFLNTHEGVQLAVDLPEEDLTIHAHPGLLERAILNCLLNSITHNDEVTMTIRLRHIDQEAHITISDDGTISPETIEKLAQKTSNYDPHGMGMIITKQIAQLHNGQVLLAYQNPGLAVTLQLPLLID